MLPKLVFVVVAFVLCQAKAQDTTPGRLASATKYDYRRARTGLNSTSTSTTHQPSTSSLPTPTEEHKDMWDEIKPYTIDNKDYFDWRLIEKVFTKSDTNTVISPFSVKLVLALLAEGAVKNSDTERELLNIFERNGLSTSLRDYYNEMLNAFMVPSDKYTLNIGTKMYISDGLRVNPNYKSILKDSFYTDIQSLDFSVADESADIINRWCSNVTDGHLRDLVSSDNLRNSVVLLINAIYFDGKWRTPFDQTFESVFFRQPTEQIRAEYITVEDKFYLFHSKIWGAKILRMPYKGNNFSMTVILPDAKAGIQSLEREMQGDMLRRNQWLMTEQKVKVTMPQFKFDFKIQMKEYLKEMGIRELFEDFTGLRNILEGSSLTKQLKVTDLIQKAGIEVNKEGTSAYAATDVEIVNKFGGDAIEEFNVNRPFVFLITEETTSNILFAGKVLDPTV